MPQHDLKRYTVKQLTETHNIVLDDDGFVFAKGTFPVLLVAHLDTVHKKLPSKINFKNGAFSSPNGIGGDDRCGIFMILEIVKQINCSVLFCEDEEIGGIGAEKFISTKFAENYIDAFNYIIEFDRKGKNEAVFYNCDNLDFENFITKDFYKVDIGSFSDISVVAPFLGCAAVNLSCGYYKAHTKNEYVVWKQMIDSMNAAIDILNRTTEDDKFEYVEGKFNNWFYDYGYGYGGYHTEITYIFEYVDDQGVQKCAEVYANTEVEAIGEFCIEHWDIPYGNIREIYPIDDYI